MNRPLSTRITRSLLKTNIRPNHISFFSFLLTTLGACFFLLGNYSNLVTGVFFAQTSSIIDGTDGEIARLKFQAIKYGAWFDAVLDRYTDAFLLFSLAIYVYVQLIQINVLIILFIGFLALIGAFMNSYTAMKFEDYNKLKGQEFGLGCDVRLFIIFLAGLINQTLLALLLIAFVVNEENIRRIVVLRKNNSSSHTSSVSLLTSSTAPQIKQGIKTNRLLVNDDLKSKEQPR